MSAIYNQRVLERSLRAPDVRHRGGRHVNHLQELHSAADAVASAAKKKKATGAGSDSRGMTSEQMVEYRLRGASEEEARQIAFISGQQLQTLEDIHERTNQTLKEAAVLFKQEEDDDPDADPDAKLSGREWVKKSRLKINGQMFRYNDMCQEREQQLGEFVEWFELLENMWPLPLVDNNAQFHLMQGSDKAPIDHELNDRLLEMQTLLPRVRMMREDLGQIMKTTADMGRAALGAELKEQVKTLQRKLAATEEQLESTQKNFDAEKHQTRDLRNDLSKAKMVADAQVKRKMDEIAALVEQIQQSEDVNRKHIDEMKAKFQAEADKLRHRIKNMKEETREEIEGYQETISKLEAANKTLDSKIVDLKSTIAEKEQNVERLRETIRGLEEKLVGAKREMEEAQEKLDKEKEDIKRREEKYLKKIEELKGSLRKIDEELKHKNREIVDLKAQVTQLEQVIAELNMQIKDLGTKIEEQQRALDEQQTQVTALEEKTSILSAANEKLQAENADKDKHIRELKAASRESDEKIEKLEKFVSEMEIKLRKTGKQLEESIEAHEVDKKRWAGEKEVMEQDAKQSKEKRDEAVANLMTKEDDYKVLVQEKQEMMDAYEKQIAGSTEAYEFRISKLTEERDALQAWKVAQVTRTFADAATEVDNDWFLENTMPTGMAKKNRHGAPAASVAAGKDGAGEEGGGMSADQMQKVLGTFKTLREKLYFQRVGFERDSADFRSELKQSLEKRNDIQAELELDISLLRQKLDKMIEFATAQQVSISEMDGAASNRMVLDLCDEGICLLEQLHSRHEAEAPSRLACELVLDIDHNLLEAENDINRVKTMIAEDVAKACGGAFDKVKVRGLRPADGSVVADVILCEGLHKDGINTIDIFQFLSNDHPGSVFRQGKITHKTMEVRLKKGSIKNLQRQTGQLRMLQALPDIMIDIERVLEGVEGALADPITLSNDPTMYKSNQDRPSSSMVAQLRPLKSVSRMSFGTDMAEMPMDFSNVNKFNKRSSKSDHEAQDKFYGEDPLGDAMQGRARRTPTPEMRPGSRARSPPEGKKSWKVEVPSSAPSVYSYSQARLNLATPVASGSRRDIAERNKLDQKRATTAYADSCRKQTSQRFATRHQTPQFTQEQLDQEALRRQIDFLQEKHKSKDMKSNTYGPAANYHHIHSHHRSDIPKDVVYASANTRNFGFTEVQRSLVPKVAKQDLVLEPQMSITVQRHPGFDSNKPKATGQEAESTRQHEKDGNAEFGSRRAVAATEYAGIPQRHLGVTSHEPKFLLSETSIPRSAQPSTEQKAIARKASELRSVSIEFEDPAHLPLRTVRKVNLGSPRSLSQAQAAAVTSHSKFTSRPVSKPITTSRRVGPGELPLLFDAYDMQKSVLVGEPTSLRPKTVAEGELAQLRQNAQENEDLGEEEKLPAGYGALPAFGEDNGADNAIIQSLGSRGNTRTTTYRVQKHTKSYDAGAAAEALERSFDPSNPAPGYRPGKVIRQLDNSFKDRKPRPAAVNPSLNAVTVSTADRRVIFNNVEMMEMAADFEELDDPVLQFV